MLLIYFINYFHFIPHDKSIYIHTGCCLNNKKYTSVLFNQFVVCIYVVQLFLLQYKIDSNIIIL